MTAAGACAAALAVASVARQLPLIWADTDARRALAIDARNPEALTRQAKDDYDAGRYEAAAATARRVINVDPLNDGAARMLARNAQERRLGGQALAWLRLAAQSGWRDRETQLLLIDWADDAFAYPTIYRRADALLRLRPTHRAHLMSYIVGKASRHDKALDALVERLSAKPPWRAEFLMTVGADLGEPAGRKVLARLAESPVPPSSNEIGQVVAGYVHRGRYAEASRLWTTFASRTRERREAAADTPSPFDWTYLNGVGFESRPSGEGPGGALLEANYDGFSEARIAEKLMALPLGGHVLRLAARTERGDPRRLIWSLSCAESGQTLAAVPTPAAPETSHSAPWTTFDLRVRIPAQGCTGQWLRLNGDPGERRTDILVQYREVGVTDASVASQS